MQNLLSGFKILFIAMLYVLVISQSISLTNNNSLAAKPTTTAEATIKCDPDNGGIQLPEGFCALIVADNLGRARHLAVDDNGDLYVAIRGKGGGIVALRDTNKDGRADIIKRFGDVGGTGIGIRDRYLYFSSNTAVLRYRLTEGGVVPPGPPEIVVKDFPKQNQHAVKPFDFDDEGWIYVNVGASSNACQENTRTPGSPGIDPCPQLEQHGGVWRFKADQVGQTFKDGNRFSTGIRNSVAIAWNSAIRKLYVVQHGRDQLSQFWPDIYTDEQNSELPAEEFFQVDEGSNFGWPYCYYDHIQRKKLLSPEYGGDGRKIGRCGQFEDPIMAFPGHWAPNDLIFYSGRQFPKRYRNGAFIAFHGSWNRSPLEQRGYKVVFVPFVGTELDAAYEVFADGFAGVKTIRTPGNAEFRPMGLAQGPDGSLYIVDSKKGRLWRIIFSNSGSQRPPGNRGSR